VIAILNENSVRDPEMSHESDASIRMTKMVDAVGTTTYTNTDFGALQSEDGPWEAYTVSYSYTTNQLRSGLSLLQPNASPWDQSYTYDEADRLASLTSPAATFGYTGNFTSHVQVPKVPLSNAADITKRFDGAGCLTGTYLNNLRHLNKNVSVKERKSQ
jgi:YD repeat-containing protein